jgi:hypothetical protein
VWACSVSQVARQFSYEHAGQESAMSGTLLPGATGLNLHLRCVR